MLDEIFLHIGMHKTGSSSIQKALAGYDDGVTFYADLGSPNHSLTLRTAFDPYPENIEPHIARGRSRADIERLKGEYLSALKAQARRSGKRMVLSGEGVCDLADDGIPEMRNFLFAHAKKVTVFAYVREPVSFMNSYFAESVKHDLTEFDVPSPEYARRLGRFRDAFEADNVIFRLFDPKTFTDASLLNDFCRVAQLDVKQLSQAMRSNESLSLEVVQVLFWLNRHYQDKSKTAEHRHTLREVRKALSSEKQTKFQLCRDVVCSALDDSDIEWFEAEFQQDLKAKMVSETADDPVCDIEDLLLFRETTKTELFSALRRHDISVRETEPHQAMIALYDAFHSNVGEPGYKRLLKRVRKVVAGG